MIPSAGVMAAPDPEDSIKATKSLPASHWRFTTRLHTKGMFTYGGRLGTDNPAFDLNFTYERRQWGMLIFKGVDLVDHETFYNFSLIAFFKNFKLSPKVTLTPYVGTFLEQENSVADHGSDLVGQLIVTIKLNPHLTFEHMGMYSNLIVVPGELDWVNRFRLTYTGKHLDIVPTLWYNTAVFDHASYWTAGLNVAYSRMKVADHIFLSAGVTGLSIFRSSDENLNPTANHFMVTLGAQIVK